MVQRATQALGTSLARPLLGLPKDAYVYDIEHRTGLCIASVDLPDITGIGMNEVGMGATSICPIDLGAAVQSATGGPVLGYDMYGQTVVEILGAGVPSKYTFAGVIGGPDDLAWLNVFSLPYKWASGGGAEGTYTPPAADGDPRGTFEPAAAGLTQLNYTVDQTDTFGNMQDRFASPAFGSEAFAPTGTIDNTGACAITIPSTGGTELPCTVTFPDGRVISAQTGTPVNYTLAPLWMSKYAKVIGADADALANLVTVDALGNDRAPVYVGLTGSLL